MEYDSLGYFCRYLDENCLVFEGDNNNFIVFNFKEMQVSITGLRYKDDWYRAYKKRVIADYLGDGNEVRRFFDSSVYYRDGDSLVFTSIIRKRVDTGIAYALRVCKVSKDKKYSIADNIVHTVDTDSIPKYKAKAVSKDYYLRDITDDGESYNGFELFYDKDYVDRVLVKITTDGKVSCKVRHLDSNNQDMLF